MCCHSSAKSDFRQLLLRQVCQKFRIGQYASIEDMTPAVHGPKCGQLAKILKRLLDILFCSA